MTATSTKAMNRRPPGISQMALTIRFARWMDECHGAPAPERIQVRFNVSRATAYRWLQTWRDALGLPHPERERKPKAPSITERKKALGYHITHGRIGARCRVCVHAVEKSGTWWLRCKRHDMWVQRTGLCDQFEQARNVESWQKKPLA